MALKVRGNDIIDLDDLEQSSKVMAIKSIDGRRLGQEGVSQAFDLFFIDSERLHERLMGQRTDTFDDFLLLTSFYKEAKDPSKPTRGHIFRKLTQILQHSKSH